MYVDHHHRHLFVQSITETMSNTAKRQQGGTVRQHRVALITARKN